MRGLTVMLVVALAMMMSSAYAEEVETQLENPLAALPAPGNAELAVDDDDSVEDDDDADDDEELDEDEDRDFQEELNNQIDALVSEAAENKDNTPWQCFAPPCPRSYMPVCVLVDGVAKTIPSPCEFDNKVECSKAMQRMGVAATKYTYLFDGECAEAE